MTRGGVGELAATPVEPVFGPDVDPVHRLYYGLRSSEMASAHETTRLISADKVEGTAVYNTAGDKVGNIKNVMIDKTSGKVAYATMASGGVLGIGSDYYALPWNALTYNTDLDGYQVAIDSERLETAPAASEADLVQHLQDPNFGASVHDFYGTRPYWQ
jgi:sporulation protein YlmC with PRC-barrel domain